MAAAIGKRKRTNGSTAGLPVKKAATNPAPKGKRIHDTTPLLQGSRQANDEATAAASQASRNRHLSVQIVTGSYERVLHGICATIPSILLENNPASGDDSELKSRSASNGTITFSDTFLFAAHASSIRCLAVSPATPSEKRILATGSSDERINLYQLATAPLPTHSKQSISLLEDTSTSINSRNRPLGNLNHHDRAVTRLRFPVKSKLFSAAEDSTIAISRTRDWTVLSSIKAPIPKPQGRPSGDTAGPGEVPAGINDFAVHPSQKLMLSVGRGERCMRLWNLMTGKKAGVLNFDRSLLAQVGEGKHSSGEGRQLLWDQKGETFVIAFERGAVVFGIDSTPKAIVRPSPSTKLHQMHLVPHTAAATEEQRLAVSTEDGRILFFSLQSPEQTSDDTKLPQSRCIGQLGGRAAGMSGRIKDFEILSQPSLESDAYLVVTGCSDGAVRLWTVFANELAQSPEPSSHQASDANGKVNVLGEQAAQIGRIIGTVETGNRVTCLAAFVMDGKMVEEVEEEVVGGEEDSE